MQGLLEIDDKKRIIFKEYTDNCCNSSILAELQKKLAISPLVAKILVGRGISDTKAAERFLCPTFQTGLENPNRIKNIIALSDALLQFTKDKTPLTIFCDFDVDGLTAGAQLYLYLQKIGANIGYYVPDRFSDGYGLSAKAVEHIAHSGSKVLITIDCGISNINEIALAKRLGLTCFVIDHHQVLNPPPADIIVDPEQDGCPFKPYKLCASGLIWMLLIVLRGRSKERAQEIFGKEAVDMPDPKKYLDLAMLGTVCDLVPLVELNRLIVFRGLEALKQTERPGLTALMELTKLAGNPRLSAAHVGYTIGPRINAVGRLGHAGNVFELLTTTDSLKAKSLARTIDSFNTERKNIEQNSVAECIEYLGQNPALLERPALAIFDENFHLGVMGIIAQRLVEQFNVPAAAMGIGEIVDSSGNIKQVIKGSVRGVPGFSVALALKNISAICINCGGHDQAGGFSIEFDKLEEFQEAFINQAETMIDKSILRKKEYLCDLEVDFGDMDFKTVSALAKLAPFGIGNPPPLFFTGNTEIKSVSALKNNGYKLLLKNKDYFLTTVIWNFQNKGILHVDKTVNILFTPEIYHYQGNSSVQLTIKEIWEEK